VSWSDFDLASALERDVLRRALPLIPSSGQKSARATLDLATGVIHAVVGVQDTLGASPEGCIELLQLRPLLTGAAWKVLDFVLEEALEQSGLTPDARRGWSIARKTQEASARTGQPPNLSPTTWDALMGTYVETVQIRHSLVHRRAHIDAAKALVGVDDLGTPLRPLSADEQDAFGRAVLRTAELVLAPSSDARIEGDLLHQLSQLTGVHGVTIGAAGSVPVQIIPELTVSVDPDPTSPTKYALDIPFVRARQTWQTSPYVDLVIAFSDQAGRELRGRLEEAPDEVVAIDPDNPPPWLL